MLTRNNAALDAQLEERPLAKKQEELQDHDDAQQASTSASVKKPSPKPGNLPKKALLKNDDHELERLGKVGGIYMMCYCLRVDNINTVARRGSFKVLQRIFGSFTREL
jgi:CO dehydrogenase nickel-insertion accessory protein CooC1